MARSNEVVSKMIMQLLHQIHSVVSVLTSTTLHSYTFTFKTTAIHLNISQHYMYHTSEARFRLLYFNNWSVYLRQHITNKMAFQLNANHMLADSTGHRVNKFLEEAGALYSEFQVKQV